MAIKLSKFINTSKSKVFWLYIVIGALISALSIMLMPFWQDGEIDVFFAPWGYSIIKIVIASTLILYLAFYLFKKMIGKCNKIVRLLIIIEFTLLSLIALGSIMSQFDIIPVKGVGQILGLVLWIRGSIEVFRAYYYDSSNGSKYPVWQLFITILLITVGAYFIISNVLTDKVVLWTLTVTLILVGIFAIILGVVKKPASKKTKKTKEDKKETK